MELAISIGVILIISICISVIWVNGINYMQENYPDYEGEDLFDEDLTTKEKKPTKKNEKNKRTN
jgi:hypothetical protein